MDGLQRYCKFGNFRKNFIFVNRVKTHLRHKKSRTGHDLPISVKDRVIWPICEGLIFKKFRVCEDLGKFNSRENFRIYSTKFGLAAVHVKQYANDSQVCKLTCQSAGSRSAVGNVSGYRCVSDCRSRGREFDPGPILSWRLIMK